MLLWVHAAAARSLAARVHAAGLTLLVLMWLQLPPLGLKAAPEDEEELRVDNTQWTARELQIMQVRCSEWTPSGCHGSVRCSEWTDSAQQTVTPSEVL